MLDLHIVAHRARNSSRKIYLWRIDMPFRNESEMKSFLNNSAEKLGAITVTAIIIMLIVVLYVDKPQKKVSITANVAEITITRINDTPFNYYGIKYDSVSILPPKKLHRKYSYVYNSVGSSEIDAETYLSLHPDDAVEKSFLDKIDYTFVVFSDNPVPDPKFFKIKEK